MSTSKWLKGNIHTHSTKSDGDSDPEHVADWYQKNSYDFLVLSDHNHLTTLDRSESNQSRWPYLILGEELSIRLGGVPIHLNGIGIQQVIEPIAADTIVDTLQQNVDLIREAGGLAQINHPNYEWAFDAQEIMKVSGASFIEVFNGNPSTNSFGGAGIPSVSQIWDRLLSSGRRIWGTAVDDAHHFLEEFAPDRSNPGRGWVVVHASMLNETEILKSMAAGDFYASTGVHLGEVHAKNRELVLEIDSHDDSKFSTIFTGEHGRELWRADGTSARYAMSRLDVYVRATVYSSRGALAWTQPVFTHDP